jgi:hypothetical protein
MKSCFAVWLREGRNSSRHSSLQCSFKRHFDAPGRGIKSPYQEVTPYGFIAKKVKRD